MTDEELKRLNDYEKIILTKTIDGGFIRFSLEAINKEGKETKLSACCVKTVLQDLVKLNGSPQ